MIYLILFVAPKMRNAALYCPKHLKCYQTVTDAILCTIYDKFINIGKYG